MNFSFPLYKKVMILRVFSHLFNFFALIFALLMTCDFFEYRFGMPDRDFYMLVAAFFLLAFLNVAAYHLYKPDKYQPCSNCREKVLFFSRWHCDSCNKDQKRFLYLVEKCGTCKERLKTSVCPHCGASIDLDAY
jgi:hypothetical protein